MNIQTNSLGVVKKKATSGGLKDAKRVAKVVGAKKMKKEPKLAAYDGDVTAEQGCNACSNISELGLKEMKRMAKVADAKKMKKEPKLAAYDRDDRAEEGRNACSILEPGSGKAGLFCFCLQGHF